MTLAVKDNGPVYTWEDVTTFAESSQSVYFFDTYLAPYLYLAKKRDKYKLSDFGYYDIKRPNGTVRFNADNSGTRAVLNNGAVIISFGSYSADGQKYGYNKLYGGVLYAVDINGPKKPNVYGKDIFFFALHFSSEKPSFVAYGSDKYQINFQTNEVIKSKYDRAELISECKTTGMQCSALIQNNGWQIPKDYPLSI